MPRSKLSDRIWITRKLRIELAERLRKNSKYAELLLTYYAVASMFFAIIDIRDSTRDFAYELLALAIFTFGCSLYLPSRRFRERAAELKNCYVALDRLITQAEAAETEDTPENNQQLLRIEKHYSELMLAHENHDEYHYLLLKYREGGRSPQLALDGKERLKLAFLVAVLFGGLIALVIFPVLLFLFF
jgi:hypothetical protein